MVAVRRIYRHGGEELTPSAEARMRAWLRAHPQHRNGVHRYALEPFGLAGEAVVAAFRPYTEHVRPEPARTAA